jgi:uncharacterized membrane protein
MDGFYERAISDVTRAVELVGVGVLIVGGCAALVRFIGVVARRGDGGYDDFRRTLGRSILLGLEILVGADIIRTIAITPSFTSVGVLGLIVVVRTFLSFSLEVELDGGWPWRRRTNGPDHPMPNDL